MIRVVTDRVLLLGLDGLYRHWIKRHEATELLSCAREVASRLGLTAAHVPIEGYYAESAELSEYFRIMRALQGQRRSAAESLDNCSQFDRLEQVRSSPLFGVPCDPGDSLPPTPCDLLYFALMDVAPNDLSIERVVTRAKEIARESADRSLVALAALVGDPVVIAALRESVVLYARLATLGAALPTPEPEYRWAVSAELQERTSEFVTEFNALFSDRLPTPDSRVAQVYWRAVKGNEIHGRCVRIAEDPSAPAPNYHWAVYLDRSGEYQIEEFWDARVWTTSYYSGHQGFPVHREGG